MKDSVMILGQRYSILEQTVEECPKLKEAEANGLCEVYAKEIVIRKIEPDPLNYKNIEEFRKKVARHEIVHAFFAESGCGRWMEDEDLVDWIAMQVDKIHRAIVEADCTSKTK